MTSTYHVDYATLDDPDAVVVVACASRTTAQATARKISNRFGTAYAIRSDGGKQMFRNRGSATLTERDLTGNGEWIATDGFCGLAGAPQP